MKIHYCLFSLFLLLTLSCGQSLKQKEMILHYNSPAEFFEEALPIGNGRLGAMVYGGVTSERISLNDITLWTGEPERGEEHIDMRSCPDVTPWADISSYVTRVRQALEEEDYALAEKLQQRLQGHFSESYQPLGTLNLSYGNADISDYSRSLDLSSALARVSCKRNGKAFGAEYFASAPDSVIVIRLTCEEPMDVTIGLDIKHPHTVESAQNTIIADAYLAYHAYPIYYSSKGEKFYYDPGRGIHFRSIVSVDSDVEPVSADGTLALNGFREAEIRFVSSSSFAGFDKDPVKEGLPCKELALANAARVAAKSYESLLEAHQADYKSFFDRVTIDLGDTPPEVLALPTDEQLKRYTDLSEANPALEALYFQYGRYLLISSSRTRGVPANLQGLWNESMDPPWSCNYTININLEENYWPALAGALPEMHEVLLDFINNMSASGRQTASVYYGINEGWTAGHNTDIWAMTCPVGLGTGDPSWANWTMGAAWLTTHIWEHYLFTRDAARLSKDYPALKGAALFCLNWLTEKDGELITSPGTSPENRYITADGFHGSTLYGCTADLAITRECLLDASEAACLLGDDAFAAQCSEALSRLRPYKIASDGHLLEWYHPWEDEDPRHRHQSHLFGVYPGHHIAPGSREAMAAYRSLEIKGTETTGWSCGWRANLYARLGDAEGAYTMFRRLLRYVSPDGYRGDDARRGGGTYPNLMDAHSPFQIDGNFGGTAAVMEMAYARPSAWKSGFINGMRTRSGETVNVCW